MKYKVKSGDMNTTVSAGVDATPMEIAMLAVEKSKPQKLALIIEVLGGHYVSENTAYVFAETVCRKLGRWEASA